MINCNLISKNTSLNRESNRSRSKVIVHFCSTSPPKLKRRRKKKRLVYVVLFPAVFRPKKRVEFIIKDEEKSTLSSWILEELSKENRRF